MKKICSKILVMLICASLLSACGKSSSGEKDTNTGQGNQPTITQGPDSTDATAGTLNAIYNGELEKNVTIRVLENDTAIEQGYFDELIKAFNEEYAEYGIVVVDANMDQYSNLADDGPYGYGPDVLYQANDSLMKYVEGKHIYPIPVESLECYSQVSENAWAAYEAEVDGVTYTMGVPINVQSSLLYYRKDMLPQDWKTNWDKNLNNVPDMVENWNDLYQYSKSIIDEGEGKYGYMKSLFDVYFSSGFLFSYGGYVFGDNNTNPEDIGFSSGEAAVGADVLLQLASIMNEECIDDSITINAYSKIADGTYFATMTTPDVYTLFIKELALQYEAQGMSKDEATALAEENLVVTAIPYLPESGNLSEENPELIRQKAMGGVNGYAISAYTKAPNACLAFVDFASSYDMVMKRNELLGVVPARSDVAKDVGGISEIIFESLDSGFMVVMPSIREMAQVWTPAQTFFQDLAKDAFRTTDKKFTSLDAIKAALESVDQQIHDAIYTLSSE